MAKLGLPSITIAFTSTGITAIERSQRGIIALILKETKVDEQPTIEEFQFSICRADRQPFAADNAGRIMTSL